MSLKHVMSFLFNNFEKTKKSILQSKKINYQSIIKNLGLPLCLFYGILFLASLVNLPVSWFGSLFSLVGIFSGILCFFFSKKQNKYYLILILLATFVMIIPISKAIVLAFRSLMFP